MAWLRRDDQTTPEGEQEWISDLLDPLHAHGDDTHDAPESDTQITTAATDPAEPSAPESDGGTPRRSVAEVIAQADPPPKSRPASQVTPGEPDEVPAADTGDHALDAGTRGPDDDVSPPATRSAADVLAAANRTGETTAAKETELPANYAARVPTTGEIPASDGTRTNVAPSLAQIMQIEGALGTALVDYSSGEMLDSRSIDGAPDMAQAAAGESAVIRTKIASLVQLDSDDDVEEVFTTLGTQYHLTRMVREIETPGLFLYLILDRQLANLAMARHKLALAARQLEA